MECLRIAWWNTRLIRRDGSRQRGIACDVVRHLIDELGVVILALGEVTEGQAELLQSSCRTRPLGLQAGNSVPRGMALYHRSDLLELESLERVTTVWRRKALGHILYAHVLGLSSPLHLFVNHWPSNHLNNAAAAERSRLAQHLRDKVCNLPASSHVVIMGDFNAEPFDVAMSDELEATRSRAAVSTGKALLYNPFWRLLGERQSLQQALLQPREGAGTYLYRSSNATSQWYTMDQLLVSAPLLKPGGWHLWEEETFVWQEPPLLDEKMGRLRRPFDHFPIVGTLHPPVQ